MKMNGICLALLVLIGVWIVWNAVAIERSVSNFNERIENTEPTDEAAARALSEEFLQTERWLGLTVNHTDLYNIESAFAEWIGAARAKEDGDAEEIKSRLQDAFRHLGRQAGFTPESVF